MSTLLQDPARMSSRELGAVADEQHHERWAHVHVNWTAVWVGALAAFGCAVVFGLVGIAIEAYRFGPEHRVVELNKLGIGALIFSVCAAFFSFAIGGWIAGKVAGILHSEPGMVHGAIAWLVAVPMLLAATAIGAGSILGGWNAGLDGRGYGATTVPYVRPELGANATAAETAAYRTQLDEYNQNVTRWHHDTPRATRNSAIGAVTALLLGLIGGVIGGWMASGEPMNFSHHRTRKAIYHQPL
jgi:ABC-type Fe3+ transport system permease subunit